MALDLKAFALLLLPLPLLMWPILALVWAIGAAIGIGFCWTIVEGEALYRWRCCLLTK